jgi:hypothetical protein
MASGNNNSYANVARTLAMEYICIKLMVQWCACGAIIDMVWCLW